MCVWQCLFESAPFKTYYKLQKHEAFRFYECGYGSLGHISSEILHYKLNKNEAFHLYVLRGASLRRQSLKIFCYKLHKHQTFHLNESREGTLSCLLVKILDANFTRTTYKHFSCMCLKMVTQAPLFRKSFLNTSQV